MNLKIKYNKVFGYYLEVTNSYKDLVPEDYIRKYAGRVVALHLRQIEKIDEKSVDVLFDKGPVDLKSVIPFFHAVGLMPL
mgnify:CR=1 FL=1